MKNFNKMSKPLKRPGSYISQSHEFSRLLAVFIVLIYRFNKSMDYQKSSRAFFTFPHHSTHNIKIDRENNSKIKTKKNLLQEFLPSWSYVEIF